MMIYFFFVLLLFFENFLIIIYFKLNFVYVFAVMKFLKKNNKTKKKC